MPAAADTYRGRFAPSTTGPAHLGTLLSALLCWCHARAASGQVFLRLEDLDPQRCKPAFATALQQALQRLGLDWDAVVVQSSRAADHAAALDTLAAAGRLYACTCSRGVLEARGVRAPDGSWHYPNTCRARLVSPDTWRTTGLPLRARLPEGRVTPKTLNREDLSQDPAVAMGDPVVRRRDMAVAYQLAVVVDDAAAGINTVVRGRDIAGSTATQVALQRLLGLPEPTYWHHFLLCRHDGQKLAKGQGDAVVAGLSPEALCGFLARAAGLLDEPRPITPRALLEAFEVRRVRVPDLVLPAT